MSPRPDADHLCPRCSAWTSTDDRFCALCGEALRGLGLSWVLEGKPVSTRELSFRTDRVPPQLRVQMDNKGHRPVDMPSLVADQPCLLPEDDSDESEDGKPRERLEGGASQQLDVVLDPEWLDGDPGKTRHVTLHLDGEGPREGRVMGLELTLFPKPELKAELPSDDFHLHLGPQPAEPFTIVVRAAVGSARITGEPEFTTGKEWFRVIRTEGERELEAGVKGTAFRVLFQVLPTFITQQLRDSDRQLKGNLELQWTDPAGEEQTILTVSVTVHVHRPPTLRLGIRKPNEAKGGFGAQFTHQVTAGLRDGDLHLVLQNAGDEELSLGNLHCNVPWASCNLAANAKLGPGKGLAIPILFTPGRDASCAHPVKVVFRVPSNDPCAPREGSPLTVLTDVRPLKEHTATVVMDFGTTASVVGLVDSQIMLPDHPEADNGVVPTLVYYSTRERLFIGTEAQKQGKTDHKSIQSHIKRDLCSGRDRVIWYGQLNEEDWRSPELITRDYLEKFLLPVQNRLKGKIARLAMTHPVTFSTKQIQTLSKIASEILNIDHRDITTWSEPVAGSFDYIIKRSEAQPKETSDDYHLLVYDFGGGTTDISLIGVRSYKSNFDLNLSLSLLGITGDQSLGGKDLTDELIDIKLGKEVDKVTRNNVFDHYETAKIIRSEFKSEYISNDKTFYKAPAYYKWVIDMKSENVIYETTDSKEHIPFTVIDNLCEAKLKRSIIKARALVSENSELIDSLVILPIGRSSAYPLVSEILYEEFKSQPLSCCVEIKRLDYSELKNCVTLGVCRLLKTIPSPDLSGMHVCTRSLGWLKDQQNAFEEIISIGTPLPLDLNQEQFTWKRFPFSPHHPIIRIFELPDSVPLPEELPDLIQPVYQDRATRHFSREELQGGLEVGAAYDCRGNLRLKLRAGGREVDVALDGDAP